MKKALFLPLVSSSILLISFGPCESELPPYQDPTEVFEGKVTAVYLLSMSSNSMFVFVTIRNTFDETLEAKAFLDVSVEIVPLRNTTLRKTFSLSASDLVYARRYNAATGLLTIDPGDSIQFRANWNFVADNGIDLRQLFFRYSPDPSCPSRTIAAPESFAAKADFKVFDRIPTASGTMNGFQMCHVSSYVPPNSCPPVLGCSPAILSGI